MAQFIGSVEGNKGAATRVGHKSSGLTTKTNGWNCGVCVVARHEDGIDYFDVYSTGGSNNNIKKKLLGTLTEKGEWLTND